MLDNDVNQKQKIPQFQSMSQAQSLSAQQQQAMQAGNPELLKQNIEDSYVANRVSESADDPKGMLYTAGIAVPTWFAISQGMDYFAKKSRGNYEGTVQYKIGQFGDKVSNTVTDSGLAKSDFGHGIANGFKSFKNFVKTKIIDKSKILSSFAYTPSKPELDMVIGQYEGMRGMQLFDYPQHGEQFVKPLKHVEDLDCYGAKEADINKFKDLINKATTPEAKAKILQEAEVETILRNSRRNLSASQINSELASFKALKPEQKIAKLKDMKAFEWGYNSFKEMEDIVKHAQNNMPKILQATNDANPRMFARIYGSMHSTTGKMVNKILGREVYASETANKLAAALGNVDLKENPELANVLQRTGLDKKIPKTLFGKAFTKYSHMVLEGATNRVAGGKLVAIMQAGYLADVLYKTAKADGGFSEKAKTFAERFTEMLAFFICMPFALKLMHHIGGLQYAGMDKKAVEAYRQALKTHNEKAMGGLFKDKKACKESAKKLKEMRNAGVKNPITKLFKCVGRVVTVGLEQIRPYDKKAITRNGIWDKIKDLGRHPKFGIKQMAGYPMRIILGMMVLLPMFNKIAVKGSHLLFGKPKHSVLDEGKEEEKTKQQSKNQPIPPQQLQQPNKQVNQTQQTQTVTQQTMSPNGVNGQSNLLNKYKNGQNQTVNSTTTTTTTTTTANNSGDKKQTEPVRTYIPSPMGVQLQANEDLSAADAAMRRADNAEKLALQALKMN